MIDLTVEISGIHFKNPVMNAAGPIGRDGAALRVVAKHGAGGLVAKTVSTTPAKVPRPCLATLDRGMAQSKISMTLNNQHIQMTKTIRQELKQMGKLLMFLFIGKMMLL